MLLGLAPKAAEYYSNRQWDSFNRGIDSDAAARAEAMSLGGMGTYSDSQGNLGTISNQALIDAYDREMFGDLPTTNNVTVGGPISNPNLQGTSIDTGGGGGGGSPSDFGGMSNQGEGGPDSYGGW
jgi:hypothetical protein